jgi:Lactate racemase N-terminal domain
MSETQSSIGPSLLLAGLQQRVQQGEIALIAACHVSEVTDLGKTVVQTLKHPIDFPGLDQVVLAGDTVAIAVSARIPRLSEIVDVVLDELGQCKPAAIDVIVDDLMTDSQLEALDAVIGQRAEIQRHDSNIRGDLSYLAADQKARPIYLNRRLVDADFVLPIVAVRGGEKSFTETLIYPDLADAQTKIRLANDSPEELERDWPTEEPAWLLGIQLMMSVEINNEGQVCGVRCGLRNPSRSIPGASLKDPEDAFDLVVASVEGLTKADDWSSAIGAIEAAAKFVEPEGTIVLWSNLQTEPPSSPAGDSRWDDDEEPQTNRSDDDDYEGNEVDQADEVEAKTDDLPRWDRTILLHSGLSEDVTDSRGIESIASIDELQRLASGFGRVGWLRAAQIEPLESGTREISVKSFRS